MKETILNNEQSINIIEQLVLNGFYDGNISSNRFELKRKRGFFNSGGNYKIVGILEDENKFELNFDFDKIFKVVAKIALTIGLILSIFSLIKGNWLLPIIFFVIPILIFIIGFHLKKQKEINLLQERFLEYQIKEKQTTNNTI